jgi:hypothetical protein
MLTKHTTSCYEYDLLWLVSWCIESGDLALCSRSEQEKELEEEAVPETSGANTSEEAVADGVLLRIIIWILLLIVCSD